MPIAASPKKEHIVILGAGWAGFILAKNIDKAKHRVTVVSPRNHFLFTPLLPSTAVGTLEFRCIQEPVRTIRGVRYLQAKARDLDVAGKTLRCEDTYRRERFELAYDRLVLAVGTMTNTFGVPGVAHGRNNVFFLKQLSHARAIRNRIVECFERAGYPSASEDERRRLLHFVIVGGGPISVEFAGELNDFLRRDLSVWYPDLKGYIKVTLVEATDHLLGTFDSRLVAYVERLMAKREFAVRTETSVQKVDEKRVYLSDGSTLECGMVVWSTGVAPTRFTKRLLATDQISSNRGRLCMDDKMRVLGAGGAPLDGVFGLGDCAVSVAKPLPTLGGIARMQANYLAGEFNAGRAGSDAAKDFNYVSLLQMSALGGSDAVIDATISPAGKKAPVVAGLLGKLLWSAAYWGFQVSLTNKMLIPRC
mmetsp:Transcript_26495/g.82764  ORF Transcript_26495/g.82764 Transcript_26495/m.82764 type:complete len:420 (-) Transcript_26495:131-1390(-)